MKLNLVETENLLRKVGKTFKEAKTDAIVVEASEQGIYDALKVGADLRMFTNDEESLFTEKEQDELGFSDEDWDIEVI